jgi:hypothetical protein
MKAPKVIELLKSLDTKELERFELFVTSPFLGNKPQVIKLFTILKKYYPDFSLPQYSKQIVFNELCPGKVFSSSLLNGYCCLLSNSVIKFIEFTANEKNTLRSKIDLLNEYRIRGLNFDFKKLARTIERQLHNDKFDISIFHSLFYYQITLLNFKTENVHKNKTQNVISLFDDYNKFLLYLTNIYVSEFLSAKINFYNNNDSYSFDKKSLYSQLESKKILMNLLQIVIEQNPFAYVHNMSLSFINIMNNPHNVSEYYKHKDLLFQYKQKFKNDELELHLNFLKTYCIERCNEAGRREEFSNEYIGLEFYILREKLFQNQKTKNLQSRSFRNILLFLSNRKDANKIHELLDYVRYLPQEDRNAYKNFGNAYFSYSRGELHDASKYLNRVKTDDKQIQLDVHLLRLKILFDQRNFVKGFEKLHSTRRTLNNNSKINVERKKRYRTFLNYIEKLFKRIEKKDEAGIIILFEEILKTNGLLYSEWFFDKYNEICDAKHFRKTS